MVQIEMEVEESPQKWEYLQRKVAREEMERQEEDEEDADLSRIPAAAKGKGRA